MKAYVLIETAAGVQRIERIVQAKNLRSYKGPWRVKRVVFGAADYANDVGLSVSMDEPERSMAVILTGWSRAFKSATVKSPVPQPASKIFAFRDKGIG